MEQILTYLNALANNNDRQWFAAHKQDYTQALQTFTKTSECFLNNLITLDDSLKGLQVKDCIYRIYRDVRFSLDKSPYKTWFGMYAAPCGGRKSPRAGYYMHIQPDNCLFAAGIWCPDPTLLKQLRKSIYDNYDEVEELMKDPNWALFEDFDNDYMLKKTPAGYPSDWIHADWLKHKTYTFSHRFTNQEVCDVHFLENILACAKAAKPMNDFLNFVFENAD